jgi:hypothetical protein
MPRNCHYYGQIKHFDQQPIVQTYRSNKQTATFLRIFADRIALTDSPVLRSPGSRQTALSGINMQPMHSERLIIDALIADSSYELTPKLDHQLLTLTA